jgi:hypothetical protein
MRTLLARDERQLSVDRAGDRLAYIAVSYGVLVLAAYRSFVDHQAVWDLLAVVIGGGLLGWTYRVAHGVLDRQSVVVLALTVTVALAVGIGAALIIGR